MTDTQLEDLKQFIDSRISQTEARFDSKLDAGLGGLEQKIDLKIEALRTEMLGGFAGVGEAIEEINHRIDEHLSLKHQKAA